MSNEGEFQRRDVPLLADMIYDVNQIVSVTMKGAIVLAIKGIIISSGHEEQQKDTTSFDS